jgi:hypothetical protein
VRLFDILVLLLSLSSFTSYGPISLSTASIQERLLPPVAKAPQIAAAQLHHPLLAPVRLHFRNGLGPDQAAVLAVIFCPKLQADRDRRGVAAAQLVPAEILPSPQIGYPHDFVTGGNMASTVSTYGFSVSCKSRRS